MYLGTFVNVLLDSVFLSISNRTSQYSVKLFTAIEAIDKEINFDHTLSGLCQLYSVSDCTDSSEVKHFSAFQFRFWLSTSFPTAIASMRFHLYGRFIRPYHAIFNGSKMFILQSNLFTLFTVFIS